MKQINDEIKIIAREEYADEFEKIEKENMELKNKNREMENKIKELSEMEDLNSKKAKKIINSLIVH